MRGARECKSMKHACAGLPTRRAKFALRGMSARRLDQLLASLGYCSRREVRAWLKAGRVAVAGKTADDPGVKPSPAAVRVDGEPLDHPDGVLLLVNKPLGLTCSHDLREAP